MNRFQIISSKPRQEKVALTNLKTQNYESYLLLVSKEKISQGKIISIKELLFPVYLFQRLSNFERQNWFQIHSTKGVSDLISFGSRFVLLGDEIINKLIENLNKNPIVKIFSDGDIVEII